MFEDTPIDEVNFEVLAKPAWDWKPVWKRVRWTCSRCGFPKANARWIKGSSVYHPVCLACGYTHDGVYTPLVVDDENPYIPKEFSEQCVSCGDGFWYDPDPDDWRQMIYCEECHQRRLEI